MRRRGGLEIEIKLDKRFSNTAKLLKEWPERTARFRRVVPYLAAHFAREKILELLPKQDQWAPYRTALEVVGVTGAPRGSSIYAVRASSKRRRVKDVDIPRTVLYVQANKRLRRTKPEIVVLEKFSPWTIQTLPFTPKRSEALVISRKVSKREVTRIQKMRRRDRQVWQKALSKTGRRETKKDNRLDIPVKVQALPDIVFEALRLEFGLGGVKARPHWKPAVQELVGSGIRAMLRQDKRFVYLFTKKNFTAWKRWPPKTPVKIRMGTLRNYLPFQKKLGIRAKI